MRARTQEPNEAADDAPDPPTPASWRRRPSWFEHGVELADADGLLTGDGSRTRAVILTGPRSLPADQLVGLLHEAIALRT